MTDKMREEFEHYVATKTLMSLEKYTSGSYKYSSTQQSWETWQAAKSVPVVGEPVAYRVEKLDQDPVYKYCFQEADWFLPDEIGECQEPLYLKPASSITEAELKDLRMCKIAAREEARRANELTAELEHTFRHLRKTLAMLDKYRFCMSYNDSYFGEPEGTVNRVCSELQHCIDSAIQRSEANIAPDPYTGGAAPDPDMAHAAHCSDTYCVRCASFDAGEKK